ncbi:uncharacterized protein UV8b_04650 [Ustilaginoidea virens]|uniref:Lysozyme n=1 Tax=Ustilaginoidea virens TaxID=1159556 RepID=A0A8E5HRU7_USTVR|nr:uncharacterized protein UV8b_04650 [Ustilaginoidea virens]QUC20409.1 hypothetical protein UV8b_04650 [Ustilaginoidea virens]
MKLTLVSVSSLLVCVASALSIAGPRGRCIGPPVNNATLDIVKEYKGFLPLPKKDKAKRVKVGYGHRCHNETCAEIGFPFPLTHETATVVLRKDIVTAQNCVTVYLDGKRKLNMNQYGALVSWANDIGCAAARRSLLLRSLYNGRDANRTIVRELPKWTKEHGYQIPERYASRKREVMLALTPTNETALPIVCNGTLVWHGV